LYERITRLWEGVDWIGFAPLRNAMLSTGIGRLNIHSTSPIV